MSQFSVVGSQLAVKRSGPFWAASLRRYHYWRELPTDHENDDEDEDDC
jgi:hypothetical protein